MAEVKEKEKPKFICKLCKLDYPSAVQFEEHLWSMLHHKAINNKSETERYNHHCNLCMFESFDLNAYGKHLIGEQHKRSLLVRRKKLEEPRQITPTATSSSKKPESEAEQGTNQKARQTRWGPPVNSCPGERGFQNAGYSQSFDTDTFNPAYAGNVIHDQWEQCRQPERFGYNHGEQLGTNQEQFRHNSGQPFGFSKEPYRHDHEEQFGFHQQQFRSNHEHFADNQQQSRFSREQFWRNQGQFRHNQRNWEPLPNSRAWRPPHSRFGQPNVGSWDNRYEEPFLRHRFSDMGQDAMRQNETCAKIEEGNKGNPVNANKQTIKSGKQDKASDKRGKIEEKSPVNAKKQAAKCVKQQNKGCENKGEHKQTSPKTAKRQTRQNVKQKDGTIKKTEASKGKSPANSKKQAKHRGQGMRGQMKPNIKNIRKRNDNVKLTKYRPLPDTSRQHEPQEKVCPDAGNDNVPSGLASNVDIPKVSRTPNKNQKKLKKKPSPKIKSGVTLKRARKDPSSASKVKTNVAEKPKQSLHPDSGGKPSTSTIANEPEGKIAEKEKCAVSSPNIPGTRHQLKMKWDIKESPSPYQPIQSDEVASTKHSAPDKNNAAPTKEGTDATFQIDAFRRNLQKALSQRFHDPVNDVSVITFDGASDCENAATLVSSTSQTVPSPANNANKREFQAAQSVSREPSLPAVKKENERSTSDEELSDAENATSNAAVSPTSTSSRSSPFKSMEEDFNKMYEEQESWHGNTTSSASDKQTSSSHAKRETSTLSNRSSAKALVLDAAVPTSSSPSRISAAKIPSFAKCDSKYRNARPTKRNSYTDKPSTSTKHPDTAARSSANDAASNGSKRKEMSKTTEPVIDDSSTTNAPELGRSSSAPGNTPPSPTRTSSAPASTSSAPASAAPAPSRSTSAPASTPSASTGASSSTPQCKEPTSDKEPLLKQVLATEQLKQKTNPRPNLTNARSRLRTNKDAEQVSSGQVFKEKMHSLLNDVARPVWQQKKLRMILAKAKKTTDRFNRFSHFVKSPSRSEDPLDIMNLSTEFQQELLDLIESEGGDEEGLLSQLTAPEPGVTEDEILQDTFGRGQSAKSANPSLRSNKGPLGSIQDSGPSLSQDIQDSPSASHTISSSTPVITTPFIKQERSPEKATPLMNHKENLGKTAMSAQDIKQEQLDFENSWAFQPSLRLQRLPLEEHSHPDSSRSKDNLDKPDGGVPAGKPHTVTSSTYAGRQKPTTFSESDSCETHLSHHNEMQDVAEGNGSHESLETSNASHDNSLSLRKSDSSDQTEKAQTKNKRKQSQSFGKGKNSTQQKKTSPWRKKNCKKNEKKRKGLPAKGIESTQQKISKLSASKSPKMRRKSVQSNLPSRAKSPAVATANKLKKKSKNRRKNSDAIYGDMDSLLEITLEENKLQATMDQLTAKIDRVVQVIQEKEELLKIFKQEKDKVINSLADLRKKRLNLLLGLTSGEKTGRSASTNKRIAIIPADDLPLAEAPHSGAESDSSRLDNASRSQATPSHRTEGFRITFGSPAHSEVVQEPGSIETFGDLERYQDGVDIGSASPQGHMGQTIEVVPQVMSRESLAKTLQELNSHGGGVKVDILSEDETLYGLDCEHLMHQDVGPPSSDVIETVAKLMNPNYMSPNRDSLMPNSGPSTRSRTTSESHPMAGGSTRGVRHKETSESEPEEMPVQPCAGQAAHIATTSSVNSLPTMKHDLRGRLSQRQNVSTISSDIDQPGLSVDCNEPTSTKRNRPKGSPIETQRKRLKPNAQDSSLPRVKQEPEEEIVETNISSRNVRQSASSPFRAHSMDRNDSNISDLSADPRNSSLSSTLQNCEQSSEDASSSQDKAVSSPRSKGYVISMYIVEDILYACISDSRFIIFNLTTNKIDAEEDLALSEIKYFALWRHTTGKMVAFASNGSRNLVQFDVKGKEFLQTIVLNKKITCLHVNWSTLFAGTVDGQIANINIQKSKINWYYDCTPSFALTAISSTLEGGMALIITASEDHTVTIRRADDGLLIRSLWGHHDVVTHLQVHGSYVLSQARDNMIFVHNFETGDTVRRVKHQTKLACCVISEDVLAVAVHAGNVYYYNIKTGKCDVFDSGCGTITCMTASKQMVFLGIQDGFIDVIPLYPSTVYQCEWSHCIFRFLRLNALKTHLQLCHINRSEKQCLWKRCLKNFPAKTTTLKVMEEHVLSHLKELENG